MGKLCLGERAFRDSKPKCKASLPCSHYAWGNVDWPAVKSSPVSLLRPARPHAPEQASFLFSMDSLCGAAGPAVRPSGG